MKRSFTLIEVLIVIAIICMLIAILIPSINGLSPSPSSNDVEEIATGTITKVEIVEFGFDVTTTFSMRVDGQKKSIKIDGIKSDDIKVGMNVRIYKKKDDNGVWEYFIDIL